MNTYVTYLNKILANKNLNFEEASEMMSGIMNGRLTNVQIAGFLMAMRMKGVNYEEIAGFSTEMQQMSFPIKQFPDALDVVGTGGAKFKSFNISSLTSIILSSMGIQIAKHGNRSSTSKSGSADFLEGLGINLRMDPRKAEKMIEKHNFVYLFAPFYHRSMKHAIQARKELKVQTLFNILGPLTNPMGVKYQLIGLFDPGLLDLVIHSIRLRGHIGAAAVNNEVGADEILNHGKTRVVELRSGEITSYTVTPQTFGLKEVDLHEIKNLSVKESVEQAILVMNGHVTPITEFAAVNGAMALRIKGFGDDLEYNAMRIIDHIESGKVLTHLETIITASGGEIPVPLTKL